MRKIDGGLPASTLFLMLCYIGGDFVVGLVPFIGDVLDAAVKANSMNVRLLEKHLDQKYKPDEVRKREKEIKRQSMAQGTPYHDPTPATVYQEIDAEDEVLPFHNLQSSTSRHGTPNRSGHATPNGHNGAGLATPPVAAARQETRGGPKPEKKGFFSGGSRKQQAPLRDGAR